MKELLVYNGQRLDGQMRKVVEIGEQGHLAIGFIPSEDARYFLKMLWLDL